MSIIKSNTALATVLLAMTLIAWPGNGMNAKDGNGISYVDFSGQPAILSFENGIVPAKEGRHSSLKVSQEHSKLGQNSLLWKWTGDGAWIEIPGEIPYLPENPNPKETSVSTFVFWVYSPSPVDGSLTFTFMKGTRSAADLTTGSGSRDGEGHGWPLTGTWKESLRKAWTGS